MATAAAEPPIDIGKPEPQLAAAIALLTWLGLFMTFGGAFFQMWQTEIGNGHTCAPVSDFMVGADGIEPPTFAV